MRAWGRRSQTAAALVALGCAATAAACIIADPGTDFPRVPERRPTIIRDRAVPPTSKILGTFDESSKFILEVEADPGQTVVWHLFLDYDPLLSAKPNGATSGLIGNDKSLPVTGGDAGVRQLTVTVQSDVIKFVVDPTRCHVIEAMIALGFLANNDTGAHAFDARGGDSIVWFYSPTGDLSGCPVYDAGDGASPPPSDASGFVTEGGGAG